jgi:micrococcal nuclease
MKIASMILMILALAVAPAAAQIAVPEGEPAAVVRVVDGDTVDVRTSCHRERVRLAGMDAPEMDQPFGPEAKAYLDAFLSCKLVTLHRTGRGVYGRIIGRIVSHDGLDVSQVMVKAGMAWAREKGLKLFQLEAMQQKRGLWAAPGAVDPREWRRRK